MDKYINYKQVIRHLDDTFWDNPYVSSTALQIVKDELYDFPAADVVPVVHGRWIWDPDGMDWNIGAWRCSECGATSPMWWNTDKTNPHTKSGHRYCPNCGTKMDGE